MLVCRVLALFATIVIMESSPALPEKIYDDNTLVIKLYSPFGQAAVGNYHDLHVAVNKALTDRGHTFSTILYAHSSSTESYVYLQYADNSKGPASDTSPVVLVEYFCSGAVADNRDALSAVHKVIKNKLDPSNAGLKIQYMVISNVDMSWLDPTKKHINDDHDVGRTPNKVIL